MKNKRGVSEVIATVLLILVTIVAAVFIGMIAIPMIKDSLSKSDCVKTVGKLNIIDNIAYSCYNDSKTSLMIEKKTMGDLKLEGIAVSLSGNEKSFLFKIKNGEQLENTTMSDGSLILNIPDDGEARTYNFTTAPGFEMIKAEIAPILEGGKICGERIFDIPKC